jgi:hypothetical protein
VSEQRFPLVRVLWNDAQSDAEEWTHVDCLDGAPCIVSTVGHLVTGRKGHVSIAQSWYSDADEVMVGSVLHVPEQMVISVDNLTTRVA